MDTMTMTTGTGAQNFERFATADLSALREELLKSGLDSWQAADVLSSFLQGRGYGVSSAEARITVSKMDRVGCTLEKMQEELERIAFVM